MTDYTFATPATKHSTFKPHGYGSFTVKRESLVDIIISEASPDVSVHMSGCRGAGKTIKIGTKLLLQQVEVQSLVKNLIKSGEEAYILVDETQANHEVA
eukprot:scaffold397411_cov28-Attheya_sp.AAC.1